MSDTPPTTYDDLPYDSWAFSETHPDHLAALATLFGMSPAPAATSRVLELGCAGGGNLIPMAVALPGARFVGVDLSSVQIAQGVRDVETLGLGNIELQHRSITDVNEADGLFDYIVCHGVYSWVPPEVQRGILEVCSRNLAPQGVAYVSYNTLPGWHLRAGVREMMTFHAQRFADTQERIGQARALLDFLIGALPRENFGAYATLLRDELNVIRARADSYLFHEHLEEHNEPVYFHEFVRRADAAGLRYLCEVSFSEMFPRDMPEEVRETLVRICPDQIHLEQYLDFLRNRMFRRTLLCHEEITPSRELKPESIAPFLLGADVKEQEQSDATEPPVDSGSTVFEFSPAGTAQTETPFDRAVFTELGAAWPAFTGLDELARRAALALGRDDGGTEAERARSNQVLLECVAAGLVGFRLDPVRFATELTERPTACPLMRLQASRGPVVTTRRHESRQMPPHIVHLIGLLDGTRTHAELAEAVAHFSAEQSLAVTLDGATHETEDAIRAALDVGIGRLLRGLLADAVLVA